MSLPNSAMSFSPFAILTSEEMNDIVENIEALAAGTGLDGLAVTQDKIGVFDKCRVYRATDASHTSTGNWQACSFVTEAFDTAGMHESVTNPSRLTVATTGYYLINAQVEFNSNATGSRGLKLQKNGATAAGFGGGNFINANASVSTRINVSSGPVSLDAGDYVSMLLYQSSGGNLAISANTSEYELGTWFSITRIS